jgi:hypothetical protein
MRFIGLETEQTSSEPCSCPKGIISRDLDSSFVSGCCVFEGFKPEDASENLHCHHT